MRFVELDLFGVYVAPISLMMVAAWFAVIALRRVAIRFELLRHVLHPALFVTALYMAVLSSMVLVWPPFKTASGRTRAAAPARR